MTRDLAILTAGLVLSATSAAAQDHALVLTGAGRFAIFADTASVTPDGDGVRMRSLQVSEEDMVIGGVAYAGGWSWWRFDCAAQTADRLDFASLKADGTEGPITPENAPPYAVAPGGDAAELAAVACGAGLRAADAVNAAEAVRIGRERMKD
ncbi:surface-adhesin E family protein [Brevundimonas sp.]|uniref:surface-adhesin E family protein n=1 Tax=Brevundimonas sp. TaxID=1871086 RepID=UPI002ED8F08E